MCKSWLLVFCLVAASGRAQVTAPVLTDVAPPPSSRFPDNWYPADNDVTYTSAAQRGAPYTATLVITWQLRDPDGDDQDPGPERPPGTGWSRAKARGDGDASAG